MRPFTSAAIFTTTALVGFAPAALAANGEPGAGPTFYKDVLPIFQTNCQNCHRDNGANFGGMIAPMALVGYDQVRPWAKAIAKQVNERLMPPWKAAPAHHGQFANERVLTDAEVATVVAWAEQGARAGNPAEAPVPVEFAATEGWSIGEPDLVVNMGEPYFLGDEIEDTYVDFVSEITAEQLPEDRWVKAVEFRGGSRAVHHIIARPLGGMAPGYDPVRYREGYGHQLKKGTKVTWNMHYHKEAGPGTGVWDQSEAAIIFWPKGTVIEHRVTMEPLGKFDFVIPPNEARFEHKAVFTFSEDAMILSYNPHMHVRGSSAKYVATYPDGKQEVILDVPKYDFNWQITYSYKEPKRVPKGTQVELTTTWDNSANNPNNPDPNQTVVWGEPTTAEMMFGWMRHTHVDPRPIVVGGGTAEAPDGATTD